MVAFDDIPGIFANGDYDELTSEWLQIVSFEIDIQKIYSFILLFIIMSL